MEKSLPVELFRYATLHYIALLVGLTLCHFHSSDKWYIFQVVGWYTFQCVFAIPKFGSGLVETWIKKYTEAHPDVHIRIVEKNKGQADLEFVSETPEGDCEEYITYVGRYALLPVTTTEIPCMRYSPVSALMRRI